MGRPDPDAMTTVPAAASSAENPRLGVRCVIFSPMVAITRAPSILVRRRPAAPKRRIKGAWSTCCDFTCVLENTHYCGQWADRVKRHWTIECHPAGCEDHQDAANPLDAIEFVPLDLRFRWECVKKIRAPIIVTTRPVSTYRVPSAGERSRPTCFRPSIRSRGQ